MKLIGSASSFNFCWLFKSVKRVTQCDCWQFVPRTRHGLPSSRVIERCVLLIYIFMLYYFNICRYLSHDIFRSLTLLSGTVDQSCYCKVILCASVSMLEQTYIAKEWRGLLPWRLEDDHHSAGDNLPVYLQLNCASEGVIRENIKRPKHQPFRTST